MPINNKEIQSNKRVIMTDLPSRSSANDWTQLWEDALCLSGTTFIHDRENYNGEPCNMELITLACSTQYTVLLYSTLLIDLAIAYSFYVEM